MKIHEFVGKRFLKSYGINVPPSYLIKTYNEKSPQFLPCVLKSQVLVGGRMKSGGVLFAFNESEFREKLKKLLQTPIKGEEPYGVLVERKMEIEHEYYLSIFIDRSKRDITYVFSENGGIEIENVRDYLTGNKEQILHKIPEKFYSIIEKLTNLFIEKDLTLLEINPLAQLKNGEIYALDAVFHLDDSAIFRQEWAKEFVEKKDYPFQYVELDGNIGIIGCGAGIVMATMDAVSLKGYKPADFLDLGGGADTNTTITALNLLYDKGIRTIVMNIFGGITKCDDIAKAIIEFSELRLDVELLVRLTGTNEDQAKNILKKAGLNYFDDMYSMIDAIGRDNL
jgi:succinyl-CoA synthetase beta subunit